MVKGVQAYRQEIRVSERFFNSSFESYLKCGELRGCLLQLQGRQRD